LNLKRIPVKYAYVHLFKGEQQSPGHQALNPSGSVPVLTHLAHPEFPITQSIAALEYLEEVFPGETPLLPPTSQALERAEVRTLVNIISNDVQPITNRRIVNAVVELGDDREHWSNVYMTRGLQAYESIAVNTAGTFSVGDNSTLADVCLVPAIWAAEKNGVDLERLPTVMRIYRSMMEMEAVQAAHWSRQADTPADMAWL